LDNAGDCVETLRYVQVIHWQCGFCKLEVLYMFKTFVSLLSGHASYVYINGFLCFCVKNSFLKFVQEFYMHLP
jgi:hypothetical protein